MIFAQTLKTALNSLRLNVVRSFLTMLGVIIGVFSVILLISIVRGFQNYIVDQFSALGSNLVFVSPGKVSAGSDPGAIYTGNKLEQKHIDLIQRSLSNDIISISSITEVGKMVKYKTNSYYATLVGGSYESGNIFDIALQSGRFYSKAEQMSKARVAVISPLVEKELFPSRNPVGQTIKIESYSFEIIGLAKEKGSQFDDRIYIPDTTVKDVLGIDKFNGIVLKAKDANKIDQLITDTKLVLLRDLKPEDFTVLSQKDILNTVQSVLHILTLGLGAIAGISLLVGGIGIMNIMLVSVTERTREVGLRKALGATSIDIGLQFLIESVVISISGGLIGLLLGWLGSLVGRSFIKTEVPLWAVLLAVGFSVLVGVVFGTYPAIKASRKDPIEALRYE